MAFGDKLREVTFTGGSSTLTLPTPVAAGNTLVVLTGSPDATAACSDNLNGAYEKTVQVSHSLAGPGGAIFFVVSTDGATAPTITLTNGGYWSSVYEIEGTLVDFGVSGTLGRTPASSDAAHPWTTTSGDIPDNSVSIGGFWCNAGGTAFSLDAPWTLSAQNTVTNFATGYRKDATAVTDALSGTYSGLSNSFVTVAAFSSFTSGDSATISDINTNNEIVPGTTATITGTNLIGTTAVTVGGVTQTNVTAVNDTTVTFTVVRGGNPYNKDVTAELTSADGNATITVQQLPESGTFAVTAANPNTTDDPSLWTGLVDTATSNPITIVDGDQAWVKNPNNLTNLAITPQGEITADQTGDFVVQIWLASEGVWGSDQTVTFTDSVAAGPAVSTVSVPTAGSYGIGDTLSFTVNWDVAATVTGTPRLPITLASGTVYADYASGTGTTALVFSYTVQEGDNDADGISLNAIELNGGNIKDASANNATLTLSGVESTAGVIVDGVRPVITIAGTNPYNMTVGETYVEQGATASDNQDGSLGSVTPTGSVDGQTEGQYTITYPGAGVVDAAGNVALDVTRVVNVNAVDAWPFGKGISYAAPKTWTWGSRHPKTGMRVRIFK